MKLPALFGFSISDASDPPVITVRGEVDLASAPQLAGAMSELIDRGHTHVAVDLGAVEFIDSTGLGVLAGTRVAPARSPAQKNQPARCPTVRPKAWFDATSPG
jgi:anti-anti-sigma factor